MKKIYFTEILSSETVTSSSFSERLSLSIPNDYARPSCLVFLINWTAKADTTAVAEYVVESTVEEPSVSPGYVTTSRATLEFTPINNSNEETFGWFDVFDEAARTVKMSIKFRRKSGSGNVSIKNARILAIRLDPEQRKRSVLSSDLSISSFSGKADNALTLLGGGVNNSCEGVIGVKAGKYLALGCFQATIAAVAAKDAIAAKLAVHQNFYPLHDNTITSIVSCERGMFPTQMGTVTYGAATVNKHLNKRGSSSVNRKYPLMFMGVVDLLDGEATVGLYGHPYTSASSPTALTTSNGHVALIPLDGYFNYTSAGFNGYNQYEADNETKILENIGISKISSATEKLVVDISWAAIYNIENIAGSEIRYYLGEGSPLIELTKYVSMDTEENGDTNAFFSISMATASNTPGNLAILNQTTASPDGALVVNSPSVLRIYDFASNIQTAEFSAPYEMSWNLTGAKPRTDLDELTILKTQVVAAEGLPVGTFYEVSVEDTDWDSARGGISDSWITN